MKKQSMLALSVATLVFAAYGCDEDTGCTLSSECNYPCEYCHESVCVANPAMANSPKCSGEPAPACTCDDGAACPDGDKSKCPAGPVSCACDDGSECPNGDKTQCQAAPACKCDDGSDCPNGDQTQCAPAGDTSPVTFSVTYGSYLNYLTDDGWYNMIPAEGGANGKGELVIMLCNEDDPTCKTPAHVRAVEESEYTKKNSGVIQPKFGPEIKLSGLPAGKWNMMIFQDTEYSVNRGRDWHFKTKYCHEGQDDWGCIVSDTDRMLVASADVDAFGSKVADATMYPKPKTIPVEIKAGGEEIALGKLILGHYFEEQMSPDYEPEQGYLAVATMGGVRVVDLETATVLKNENGMYDFALDLGDNGKGKGQKFQGGTPCGIIDNGDGEIVWVIYNLSEQTTPNIAIPFNVKTQKQVGSKHVAFGHYLKNDTKDEFVDYYANACRGVVKDNRMYILSRRDGEGESHVYYAPSLTEVLEDQSDIEAFACNERYETGDCKEYEPAYLDKTDSLAVWHDTVYSIIGNLMFNAELRGSGGGICAGYNQCIFKTKAGEKLEAITNKDDASTFIDAGPYNEDVNSAITGSKIECREKVAYSDSFINTPAITIVEKSETEAWMFTSKCLTVLAYKLTYDPETGNITEEQFDLSPKDSTTKSLDASIYGVYINEWKTTPDKKYLIGFPSGKSLIHYTVTDAVNKLQNFNRMEALVIDLTGSTPVVSTEDRFNMNHDGHSGAGASNSLKSPEIDPGIDLMNMAYVRHLVEQSSGLGGAIHTLRPNRPLIAVSNNYLWLSVMNREAGPTDITQTLSMYRDLVPYSLKENRAMLWSNLGYPYFRPIMSGGKEGGAVNGHTRAFGFALDPDDHTIIHTFGVVYLPK